MEACLETNIQGNECTQDMPFQLLHCSLTRGWKFVLNVLVFVCPHFMWPWPSPFQQTLGSLYPSLPCNKLDKQEKRYIAFFFFCPETYKIFPDFIYLSHTPGRSFHGRQQMIINGLLPPSKLRISSGMLHSENGLDKLSYGRKLQLHNWKKVKEFL